MKEYFPQRGDVVWLDHDPQRGHEQAGKRPVIVISSLDYDKKVGLALFYPVYIADKRVSFRSQNCSIQDTGCNTCRSNKEP